MDMDHQLCEIIDIFDFPDDESRFRVTEKLTSMLTKLFLRNKKCIDYDIYFSINIIPSEQILESSEQLCETLFKKGTNVLDKAKGTKKFGENKVSRE